MFKLQLVTLFAVLMCTGTVFGGMTPEMREKIKEKWKDHKVNNQNADSLLIKRLVGQVLAEGDNTKKGWYSMLKGVSGEWHYQKDGSYTDALNELANTIHIKISEWDCYNQCKALEEMFTEEYYRNQNYTRQFAKALSVINEMERADLDLRRQVTLDTWMYVLRLEEKLTRASCENSRDCNKPNRPHFDDKMQIERKTLIQLDYLRFGRHQFHHDVLKKYNADTGNLGLSQYVNQGLRLFIRSLLSYSEEFEPINMSKKPIEDEIYCIAKAKKRPPTIAHMKRFQNYFTDLQFYFHYDSDNEEGFKMTCTDGDQLTVSLNSTDENEQRKFIYNEFYRHIVPKFKMMSFLNAEEFGISLLVGVVDTSKMNEEERAEAVGNLISDLQASQADVLAAHPERKIMYTFTEWHEMDPMFQHKFDFKGEPFVFIMDNHINYRPFYYINPSATEKSCFNRTNPLETYNYGNKDHITNFVDRFYNSEIPAALMNENIEASLAKDYKQKKFFADKNNTIIKINSKKLEEMARDQTQTDFIVLSCTFDMLMCRSVLNAINLIKNHEDSNVKKDVYFLDSSYNEIHMQDGAQMSKRPKKGTIGAWFKQKQNIVNGNKSKFNNRSLDGIISYMIANEKTLEQLITLNFLEIPNEVTQMNMIG